MPASVRAAGAVVLVVVLASLAPSPARAQQAAGSASPELAPSVNDPSALATFYGGIPSGQPTAEELPLTLADAIARGLRSNLGAILGGTAVEAARGAQREARADLLPQIRASVAESRQTINLEAYGFTLPGVPPLVGPFNVFDARAHVQQSILDLRAIHRTHAAGDALEAARQDELGARDLVVVACGQLYLQALAGEARIAAARAQLATAESLLGIARDRRASGLGAGIEVLRADVQAQSLRQRQIVAEQEAAKQKLQLARAIGLPLGQRFRLADPMPFAAGVPMSVEDAVARAWAGRPELKAAQARRRRRRGGVQGGAR